MRHIAGYVHHRGGVQVEHFVFITEPHCADDHIAELVERMGVRSDRDIPGFESVDCRDGTVGMNSTAGESRADSSEAEGVEVECRARGGWRSDHLCPGEARPAKNPMRLRRGCRAEFRSPTTVGGWSRRAATSASSLHALCPTAQYRLGRSDRGVAIRAMLRRPCTGDEAGAPRRDRHGTRVRR